MKREQPRTPYEETLSPYEKFCLEQQLEQEEREAHHTPVYCAVVKLMRKHGWKMFPANLELENGKFNKKSYLSKEYAPGGENWGMTNDLKQLESNFCGPWWQDRCGIGVPTGADNGIFVIETDTKKGGHKADGAASLQALEAKHGKLPETLMAESPSESKHRYYKHPGKAFIKNSDSELAPGIDVRGDGGMVIAPPSKRGDGTYRWLNALPIAEAPTWLLALVIQHDTGKNKSKKDTSKSKKGTSKSNGAAAQGKKKSNGAAPPLPEAEMTADEAASAYAVIPNDDVGWEEWNRLGMAGWRATAGAGFAGFDSWSQKSSKYNAFNTIKKWMGYYSCPVTEIGAGTLIMLANEADPNWRGRAKQEQPEQPWPTLAPEALYGLAGEVVALFEPHTEADPVALQLQFMAAFGSAIGRGAYVMVEGTRHYTNLFGVLVGETSKSRKGTAGDRIRQVFRLVAPIWEQDRIRGGLSSGEGLVWQIRDEVTKTNKSGKQIIVVDGVADKRLLLDEREFFAALTVMKREGNIVSRMVRDAWDGRPLASLTKNDPTQCLEPHVSLIGHITEDELRLHLDQISMANGYANRLLFTCVRRSKFLPFGGSLEQDALDTLAKKVRKAYRKHYKVERELKLDDEARKLWAKVYRGLSEGKFGLLGAITGRAEAQTIRLALLYAVLDGEEEHIKVVHLRAALALWKYCEDSARYIFGASLGDTLADTLLQALRSAGGMSRTEIRDHFKRNVNSGKLDAALKLLKKHGMAKCEMRSKPGSRGGPKVEFWSPI
jgi:bifunctional DNA primase/polymerase-like protein/uncharacterized protein DUF3987/primase-like protein